MFPVTFFCPSRPIVPIDSRIRLSYITLHLIFPSRTRTTQWSLFFWKTRLNYFKLFLLSIFSPLLSFFSDSSTHPIQLFEFHVVSDSLFSCICILARFNDYSFYFYFENLALSDVHVWYLDVTTGLLSVRSNWTIRFHDTIFALGHVVSPKKHIIPDWRLVNIYAYSSLFCVKNKHYYLNWIELIESLVI